MISGRLNQTAYSSGVHPSCKAGEVNVADSDWGQVAAVTEGLRGASHRKFYHVYYDTGRGEEILYHLDAATKHGVVQRRAASLRGARHFVVTRQRSLL